MTIITLTAASGSGKTSIAGWLLDNYPQYFSILPSNTTRDPRPGDLPGEYNYLSLEEYLSLKENNEFAWTPEPVHGNYYATLNQDLETALNSDSEYHLCCIIPEIMPVLSSFVQKRNGLFVPFYIDTLEQDILIERLRNRGDSEDKIKQRIIDCRNWEQDARKSNIPYVHIQNNTTIEESALTILGYLNIHPV